MMSNHLDAAQITEFHERGYLSPLPAIEEHEALACRRALEAFEAEGASGNGAQARLPAADLHLLFRWAWDVVHDPRIVVPVSDVLGPNVLLWSLNWFIKEARDGKFVTWHQDATYWGLEPHDVVTAWVALSDAGPETGPMRFLPGSHRGALYRHENTHHEDNLLSRGQRIDDDLDEDSAVLAPLRAGEMSLHHVRLVHGSVPNRTDDRRIGLVLRYCATHVRQTHIARDTATLVAGEDRFDHFDLMPPPERDLGAAEVARHRDSIQRMVQAIMQ